MIRGLLKGRKILKKLSSSNPQRLCRTSLPQLGKQKRLPATSRGRKKNKSNKKTKTSVEKECVEECSGNWCRSVLNYVGLVPSWILWFSCDSAILFSWVQNIFSWVFRGSKFFSMDVSWVRNFFSWVLRVFKFVGPRFFLVGVLWVQKFFSRVFRASKVPELSIKFSKKKKEKYSLET